MTLTIENILLIGSILLFISILAGKTSFHLGVPTLVLFLAVGMLAGSDGIGKIQFDNPGIAQFIGIIAFNLILFSGGFETDWSSVKPVFGQALSLSILGVLLTSVILGLFIWWVTDFTLYEGLLLGSIVSSTDAAAVFSILRSKKLALKGHIRPLLEFESGSNDPMAYILTIIFLSLVENNDKSFWSVVPLFFEQLLVGCAFGFFFGYAGKFIINRIRLDYEGLYPALVITLMLLAYSITSSLGGNGFLAVYLSALYLGNQELLHKRTIMKMYDCFAWLMQIILFVTLGLLVFPSRIIPVIGIGLLISVFLIFIARPVATYLCLTPFRLKNRIKLFVSWVGLRGAVPIVFATFPLMAGIEKADILLSEPLNSEMAEVTVSSDSSAAGMKIIDLGFPQNARIALLKRGEKYIIPDGQTVIMPEDKLILIAGNKEILTSVIDDFCVVKEIKPDP